MKQKHFQVQNVVVDNETEADCTMELWVDSIQTSNRIRLYYGVVLGG